MFLFTFVEDFWDLYHRESLYQGWEQANFNRFLRCEMPDYII